QSACTSPGACFGTGPRGVGAPPGGPAGRTRGPPTGTPCTAISSTVPVRADSMVYSPASRLSLTLQTLPARPIESEGDPNGAARAGGFSLHAGVDIAPGQRAKLERLCRYVSRPPVATE